MPTNTAARRSSARSLAATAVTLLLVVGGLLIASPASAHDELVSTDPAADAALETLPEQLTLTFSGELATAPGATELQVTDAAGTSLAEGKPTVDGTEVIQPLSGAASGAITVRWKVVSSDGHPVSGEFGFTVTSPPIPTPTETPTATTGPPATPTTEPMPIQTAEPDEDFTLASAWPWVIGGVVLLGIVGAILYLLVSRKRRNQTLSGGSGTPDSPDTEPSADR